MMHPQTIQKQQLKYTEKDKRIKLIKKATKKEGQQEIKELKANGKYICFLDSDDEFCDNHLENFTNTFKKKMK